MSKMPAKKKSCFQITSVTTAQVATSITEDTESLDDPDESRTEDVSSEIFDVSRATDYGPEEVCERSSSEETLNNVGDAETPGTVSPNLLLDGQLAAAAAAPANGGGVVSARSVSGALASTLAAAATSAPASGAPGGPPVAGSSAGPVTAAPSQPPTACSSRFRVIKLDHGSGEPYRRGRWTCMEYYERDSDSSVLTRSGDCIRHSNTFDQTAERDSGLGATGGSVVVVVASMQGAHGPESGTDSSLTAVSQLPPSEKMSQPTPAQPQSFSVGQPQPPPPPVGGAVAQTSAPLPPFPGAKSKIFHLLLKSSDYTVRSQLHFHLILGSHRNPSTAFYQAFHLNTLQESKSLWDSASGGGVVAIDNKIEQAMDLVKSHLMYAVREEVEVLKEQIKELVERNSLLERENALLKSLSNNDQLSQLPTQQANPGSTSQQQAVIAQPPQPTQPPQQPNVSSA
ncbi:PREDICTED: TSC22 domain family protein 2 [Mandrillus leucophaeus]|uniref:TSC22 domain family protein 2 n=1 Tax=Mandrillus leucophaeus TaxID=9568 RepID=UPI0005F518F0|nr:PREDICTED: TSC22 domain family protein 2 [Mandrillus leucophaeus]